jgi:transposase
LVSRKSSRQKLEELRERGCLNPKPQAVGDDLFGGGGFFDARDVLQVKYEMVRRVRVDGAKVSHAARSFGFSRPSVYQAVSAFEQGGVAALLPEKPGPRRAHKLREDVVEHLRRALADDAELSTSDLVAIVRDHFGLSVHGRSVERALKRREKKRR